MDITFISRRDFTRKGWREQKRKLKRHGMCLAHTPKGVCAFFGAHNKEAFLRGEVNIREEWM